jgi:hypothetical protein
MATVGRNDPCACGSGRKYKHCCLPRADADRTARVRLQNALDDAATRVFAFALNRWGEPLLVNAWREFTFWENDRDDDGAFAETDLYTGQPDADVALEDDAALEGATEIDDHARAEEDLDSDDNAANEHARETAGRAAIDDDADVEAGGRDDDADDPRVFGHDPDFAPLFLPFFLFTFIADPNDATTPHDAPQQPLARAYQAANPDRLDALQRELIDAACGSGFSFHVVREVTAEAIVLADILTGDTVRVLASRDNFGAEVDDILFAFIASTPRGAVVVGADVNIIPPPWHNVIIEWRESAPKYRHVESGDLAELRFEIREFFFELRNQMLDPSGLVTGDGDPFEPTRLVYTLHCRADEAFDALLPLSGEPPAADEIVRAEDGGVVSAAISWRRDDGTALGLVSIAPGRLEVETTSTARTAAAEREVAARLGARAVLETREVVPIDELLSDAELADDDAIDEDETGAREREAVEGAALAEFHEDWADEPIPALGNITPREAAGTAIGRERLEALFAEYRWRDRQHPRQQRADIAALRRSIGL